jgi:succinate dehydrogenase / fumarate reductase cytochrome b subunit
MAIWIARAVMLVAVVVHVYVTLKLAAENRAARGSERYGYSTVIKARRSSLIMHWTGLLLLAFIIYHLLHFTFRVNNDYNSYTATVDGKPVHDVYKMVIAGFSWWPASAFYIVAMGCLCSHLSHGVSSMFQTLGLSTEKTRPGIQLFAYAYAILIFVGNCSIPLAVLMGYFNK